MILEPPLTGQKLLDRIKHPIKHEPLVEGFLYKGSSLMITSQPEVGKSTLTIQAVLQMSSGLPLFGVLETVRPIKVWYIQMERSDTESLERIQAMMNDNSSINSSNIFIDVELQALNFLNDNHFQHIIERGKQINPDVIIIDPLYGIAPGLSKDVVGSSVAKYFTIMKKELNAALWINHHTTKYDYEIINGMKVEKEDPFYGAQWLKAHITGSFLVRKWEDGTELINKKNSHKNLIQRAQLVFDHDTYMSTMKTNNLSYTDRYKLYINSIFRSDNKTFFFKDALSNLGCTIARLRQLNCTPEIQRVLSKVKVKGDKTLYVVSDSI